MIHTGGALRRQTLIRWHHALMGISISFSINNILLHHQIIRMTKQNLSLRCRWLLVLAALLEAQIWRVHRSIDRSWRLLAHLLEKEASLWRWIVRLLEEAHRVDIAVEGLILGLALGVGCFEWRRGRTLVITGKNRRVSRGIHQIWWLLLVHGGSASEKICRVILMLSIKLSLVELVLGLLFGRHDQLWAHLDLLTILLKHFLVMHQNLLLLQLILLKGLLLSAGFLSWYVKVVNICVLVESCLWIHLFSLLARGVLLDGGEKLCILVSLVIVAFLLHTLSRIYMS